ncbi:hypothetical protein [Streptomyces sp. NPDC003697]
MGERQSDGSTGGRRRGHPAATVPGPERTPDGPALQSMLAAALRGGALDVVAEQRAVAAFRAARDGAAHGTRTRSGDDWRSRGHRRVRLSVKALLGVFAASLTLGGVAVAAIGTAGSPDRGPEDGQRSHRPSAAPAEPSAGGSATASRPGAPAAPATPGHPAAPRDVDGRCRAYEQVRGAGRALDAPAWRWLVAAAGGEENVGRYCAERTGRPPAGNGPKGADGTASPAAPGGAASPGSAAGTGTGAGTGAGSGKGGAGRENGGGAGSDRRENGTPGVRH